MRSFFLLLSVFVFTQLSQAQSTAQEKVRQCVNACYEEYGRPSAELKACVDFCQKKNSEPTTAASGLSSASRSSLASPSDRALQQLVLGVNLDISEKNYLSFPCNKYASTNIFSCGTPFEIQDRKCQASLTFKKLETGSVRIQCQLSSGKTATIAESYGKMTVDSTQDGFGFFQLKFSSGVSVREIAPRKTDRVSVIRYQIVIN